MLNYISKFRSSFGLSLALLVTANFKCIAKLIWHINSNTIQIYFEITSSAAHRSSKELLVFSRISFPILFCLIFKDHNWFIRCPFETAFIVYHLLSYLSIHFFLKNYKFFKCTALLHIPLFYDNSWYSIISCFIFPTAPTQQTSLPPPHSWIFNISNFLASRYPRQSCTIKLYLFT